MIGSYKTAGTLGSIFHRAVEKTLIPGTKLGSKASESSVMSLKRLQSLRHLRVGDLNRLYELPLPSTLIELVTNYNGDVNLLADMLVPQRLCSNLTHLTVDFNPRKSPQIDANTPRPVQVDNLELPYLAHLRFDGIYFWLRSFTVFFRFPALKIELSDSRLSADLHKASQSGTTSRSKSPSVAPLVSDSYEYTDNSMFELLSHIFHEE